ncbi:MAG TPA: sensor histidine kinase [Candidatus Dorea intestinavium]|nr:sensor histidine kinase [Candidatus Dorea intestinavium]
MLGPYLKGKLKIVGTFLGFILVLFFVMFLNNADMTSVIYGFILIIFLGIVLGIFDFIKARQKHLTLQKMQKDLEAQLPELPKPESLVEEDYQEAIKKLFDLKQEVISKDLKNFQEMLDYYEMWVHQIKVPIASMSLLLQSFVPEEAEEAQKIRELKAGLLKVEQYVEMVLSYLRLDGEATDYLFAACDLDEVIKRAVKSFATVFNLKKLSLSYSPVNKRVLTDKKWLEFVIKQIISNALKYTRTGTISIAAYAKEDKTILVIEDTGIGIRSEDLPRLFEKGFTGYNGRMDKKSTGIGLYLCQRILENLGHKIYATSSQGKGTKVFIEFDNKRLELRD